MAHYKYEIYCNKKGFLFFNSCIVLVPVLGNKFHCCSVRVGLHSQLFPERQREGLGYIPSYSQRDREKGWVTSPVIPRETERRVGLHSQLFPKRERGSYCKSGSGVRILLRG